MTRWHSQVQERCTALEVQRKPCVSEMLRWKLSGSPLPFGNGMPGPDLKTNHIQIDVMGSVDVQIRDELERVVPMMIMWDPADRNQASLIINHSIIFDVEQMCRNHNAGWRSCEISSSSHGASGLGF
eukprot:gene9256-16405_t